MRRLFTFGCSFTNWIWPTWADIYATQFDFFENWGHPNAGNLYIFNSIIEANVRHRFTPSDTIVIMWSGMLRVDRYDHGWKWGEQSSSIRGSEIINYGYMNAINQWFDSAQLNYTFLSMYQYSKDSDVYKLYKDTIDKIKPMVYVPQSRTIDIPVNDVNTYKGYHQFIADQYAAMSGPLWPSFEEYIRQFPRLNIDRQMKTITQEIKNLQQVYVDDAHPTPADYLINLQQWFNFSPTVEVAEWVKLQTELITKPKFVTYVSNSPRDKLI